ncbi:MAG TPA: PQQ-dependent sugar dehydrogenase [Anaerolineales bacterium]|nr:PQQ-dependent sugar dehydrogenase [Anaerolineales bacterium]HQX15775.1 PQQ-dependent sugar dehydrogenase [Anaerolineales bacterium]
MSSKILRALLLIFLLTSLLPQGQPVRAAPPLPPVEMFQLPWELGKAWVAYDGFGRHATSAHNPANGGAVDFAPHPDMKKGENTSNAWVTAAANGTVVAISKCHLILAHSGGWVSEYQHLANFQVKLGDAVTRNQRLAVIANASAQQPVCLGSVETDTPHLHFSLRPNMVGATFAGWEFRYNALFKTTTFKKENNSEGLFKPLLNVMGSSSTTPTPIPTTPTSSTPATPTLIPTATSAAPSGPYVSTTVNTPTVAVGDTALVTVNLNNVPVEGYTSAEITCAYNASLIEASNIVFTNLFGADAATTIFGPQGGSFIAAIAGKKGNRATTSGTVFTFTVKGLQAGLTAIDCTARISQGNGALTSIPYVGTSITVLGLSTPTPTVTSTPVPASPTSTLIPTSTSPSATPTVISTPLGPGDLVPSLSFVPIVTGLSQPVLVTNAGDGSGRLFVLERVGRVRVITNTGSLLPTSFLDLTSIVGSSGSEEGLLGLAFHPNYESNGLFFVAYTDTSGNLVLAKYSVSADPNVANPASAVTVLGISHPNNANHNGGMLAFGNDGYLYWSVGDGGGAGDVPNNAQNTNILLGKILRLDVNSGSPYAIPSDNPFVGVSGARGEIWDYGFRNPWRFSFDRGTYDMYVGDVGQGSREEIDFESTSSSGGLNYGWRVMEGSLCFNPSSGCDTSGKVFPVAEYDNTGATCAVTGGYVYRGSQSAPMTGIYFYGDYCSGEIWGLLQQSPGVWDSDLIADTSFFISSFGEDEAGELYLTDYSTGTVQKIVGPSAPAPTATFTPVPFDSPTPTFTSVPGASPTPTAIPTGSFTPLPPPTATTVSGAAVTGQVIASKVVTVRLYDLSDNLVASVNANPDGTFRLDVPAGTYNIVATANGFLRIQGQITLSNGETHAMPVIALLAGDIDDDGSIDQFDAMTIGFSYGTSEPPAADLNNDGIINIFDLELLAKNYRKTGPIPWE